MCEPLSGRFSVLCRPEEGGEGIQRAIRDCPAGGSIFLRAGVYHVTQTLRLDRSVHIFGRGQAELRGQLPPPRRRSGSGSGSGGGGPSLGLIEATAPGPSGGATLDRVLIEDRSVSYSRTLHVPSGALRLQGCHVASWAEKNGFELFRAASGAAAADLHGCTFSGRGGGGVLEFAAGAAGHVVDCEVRGFGKGYGVNLSGEGTAPVLARNTIRECKWGVTVEPDVGPGWSLGEGHAFAGNSERDVWDMREPPPAEAPAGRANT